MGERPLDVLEVHVWFGFAACTMCDLLARRENEAR
jgi:hypothetical protein